MTDYRLQESIAYQGAPNSSGTVTIDSTNPGVDTTSSRALVAIPEGSKTLSVPVDAQSSDNASTGSRDSVRKAESKQIPDIMRPTIPETREEVLARVTTRGLSGLSNLGNTCYMNAALQALSSTKTLLAYLIHPDSKLQKHLENRILDDKFTEHEKEVEKTGIDKELVLEPDDITQEAKGTLTYKLRIMFKYMWARNCEVHPKQFKKGVDKQLTFFNDMRQHDSQEFLTALLDKIHENTKTHGSANPVVDPVAQKMELDIKIYDKALEKARQAKDVTAICGVLDKLDELEKTNRPLYLKLRSISAWKQILKDSYSEINNIFSGQSLTTVSCEECKKSTHNFERFDIMSLHLPEEVDLNRSKYTLRELLGNYVGVEEMKDKNKYQCNYCMKKTNAVKQNVMYQQPNVLVLMIKKYQKYQGRIIKSNIKVEYEHELDMTPYMSEHVDGYNNYELYAAIRHSGGYGGGHYYSYTKNPINGLWFLCDDGDIYHVPDDEVLDANGYVLFYRQKEQKVNEAI